MTIGNMTIDKTMMPSYAIGADYPTRRYQFYQDTLSGALNKQMQLQNPQNGVATQGVGAASNQPSTWNGGQQ